MRDDRGRLQSLTGPACAYPDGWAIYAVHGVRVPRYVIKQPREIDIASINDESNVEVRRMIERYGHGEKVSGAVARLSPPSSTTWPVAAGKSIEPLARFG